MLIENHDESVEINRNPNSPYISDHSYRLLIICGSGSWKNNALQINKTSTTKY